MAAKKIWAVIPAYNEGRSIKSIIENAQKYVDSVVVVDDGSRDSTKNIAEKAGAMVLSHVINLGKGATLRTGCDFAASKRAKYIIVLDADAQHNPADIPRFTEKLGKYDIVFSYRKRSAQMPFVLRFGNWFISRAMSFLYGIDINDTQSGYRAFSAEAYKKIRWNASDYSMETEMISKAGKQKLKYVQIPIGTIYSDKYKGTTIIDGIKIVLNMVWWKIFNGR
ncbi:MAG TPA: glycosyltransferase family 2 protein [Candidatus Nanoarchaeia archaeon]|nr:glycosyltransferase family 2 protein [Candidatus Nanoarchaeia archaeon]